MTSSKACSRALPVSAWMRSSTSSCRFSSRSWKRSSTPARCRTGSAAQAGCARRASVNARSTSPGADTGRVASTSPVSGATVSATSSPDAVTPFANRATSAAGTADATVRAAPFAAGLRRTWLVLSVMRAA